MNLNIAIALGLVALFIASGVAQVQPTGLVAYYRFDGNTKDATQFHRDAVSKGAISAMDRNGSKDKSYRFDGTSYMILPGAVYLGNEFTIALWINPDVTVSWCPVISFHSNSPPEGVSIGTNGNAQLSLTVQLGDSTTRLPSSNVLHPGIWTHVAFTVQGGKATVYENSDSKNSALNFNTPTGVGGSANYIGTDDSASNDLRFVGRLDEIRIYDRGLSKSEIQSLYHEESKSLLWSPLEANSPAPSPLLRRQMDDLMARLDAIITLFRHEEVGGSNEAAYLAKVKEPLPGETTSASIGSLELSLSNADTVWQQLQNIKSSFHVLKSRNAYLMKERLGYPKINETIDHANFALRNGNLELTKELVEATLATVDSIWQIHHDILTAQNAAHEVRELGGDISEVTKRIDAANEALGKSDFKTAQERSREAIALAGDINLGSIPIADLHSQGAKYDLKKITLTGKIKQLNAGSGLDTALSLDDGTGTITVILKNRAAGLIENQEVQVVGVYYIDCGLLKDSGIKKVSWIKKHTWPILVISLCLAGLIILVFMRNRTTHRKQKE